jgi:hypothetical protein
VLQPLGVSTEDSPVLAVGAPVLDSSSMGAGWCSGGPHVVGRPSSPVGKSGAEAGTGMRAWKALSRPCCCAKMAAESLIREVGG